MYLHPWKALKKRLYAPNQNIFQILRKPLGVQRDWQQISSKISITGIGRASSEKRHILVILQKIAITGFVEEYYLKNSMQLSAIYIIFASIIWGFDGFVRQSTPITGNLLIALETTIAGVLVLLFLLLWKRSHIKKLEDKKALVAITLLWGVAWSWFFVHALAATESLWFIFVLFGLQPIFTIISSALLLGEHPRGSFYAFAATTIFASILLTLWDTGLNLQGESLPAYIYALCTALCWGTATTLNKIVIKRNSALYTLGLRFLFTGLIGWIIVFFSNDMIWFSDLAQRVMVNPMNILFLIFISDIFAMGIYLRGLRNIPATLTSIFELTFPLTGFIIDYILYDVVPSPMKTVAAFTILLSILIMPYCHFIEESTTMQKIVT